MLVGAEGVQQLLHKRGWAGRERGETETLAMVFGKSWAEKCK